MLCPLECHDSMLWRQLLALGIQISSQKALCVQNFISMGSFDPHTDLQKNSHFRNLRGPADPKNIMILYKQEFWYWIKDNYSWSNDQCLLGSAGTPKIRMRVNKFLQEYF